MDDMGKTDKMLSLESILDESFDYEEALSRQNLSQSDVDLLKEKVKTSKYIPASLNDKQVFIEIFQKMSCKVKEQF